MQISADELKLLKLNERVELLETFLRVHVNALWWLMLSQKRYRELEEDYNQLLHKMQLLHLYEMENEHLWKLLLADNQP